MLKLLSLLRKPNHAASGFTLVELLVAMTITSIMLSFAGFGIVAIMQSSQRSLSESDNRTNLNRALEFISDEVRMAKSVAVPSTGVPTGSCESNTGVLNLTMPDNSRVVYYIRNVSGCTATTNPDPLWTGPALIRRRIISNTNTLVSDTILVDGLTAPASAPGCSATSAGGSGFYACISNSRSVTIEFYGKMVNPSSRTEPEPYNISSQVAARSF